MSLSELANPWVLRPQSCALDLAAVCGGVGGQSVVGDQEVDVVESGDFAGGYWDVLST